MFFGTTPQIVSQYIYREIAKIKPRRVFVPFAGNFVIEQLCGLYDKSIEVHSTDVSLYSRAIGAGITDTPIDCTLRPEMLELFPGFADRTSPIEIAAQVIFFSEVAKNLKKAHIYYQHLNEHSKLKHNEYLDKIVKKLEAFKANIGNLKFYGVDACEVIPLIRENDMVFYDPPVILGDYEKMFKPLEDAFTYSEPSYTQMTDELKAQQLQDMHNVGAYVFYRTNNPSDNVNFPYEQVFHYQYKWHGSYCIYSNCNNSTFVGSFSPLKEKVLNLPLINETDVITENSKVEFVQVQSAIGNHYRLLWVKKAEMSDAGYCFIILVDGKVIGMCQIESSIKFGTDWAVIYSDPACPHSQYKRLSKLILHLICTQQTLDLINELSVWEHKGFTTRVFTNNPVSMKYRGLFDLSDRKEVDGNFKYALMYKSKSLHADYQTALRAWIKKDGKVLEPVVIV